MFRATVKILLTLSSLLAAGLFFHSFQSAGAVGEWEIALAGPVQSTRSGSKLGPPVTLAQGEDTWRLFPRADYRIAARVLHDKQYDDWQAVFVPVDLALGWGEISRTWVDKWVKWRQDNRWYYYQLQKRGFLENPLSAEYVREHSANVHVIPANRQVARALRQLERDSLIVMEGKLVDVEAHKDGKVRHFYTSLSRTDSGDASCEIMYVERLVISGRAYR